MVLLSFIKDAHSFRREADTVCDLHAQSQTSFALAAITNYTPPPTLPPLHTRMLVWQKLSVYSALSPPRLPDVESSKSWCRRHNQNCVWADVGTAEDWLCGMLMWCGCTCLFCEKPFSEAVKVRGQGSARSFIPAGSFVGECIPSGNCPHLQRYSRKPICAAVTDYATAPLPFGSWDKWKELIAKRGCDLFSRSKLALTVHK